MNKNSYRAKNKAHFQIPPFAKPLRVLQLVNYFYLNKKYFNNYIHYIEKCKILISKVKFSIIFTGSITDFL